MQVNLREKIKEINCSNCRFDCKNKGCNVTENIDSEFNSTISELKEKSVFTLGFFTVDIREIIERLR